MAHRSWNIWLGEVHDKIGFWIAKMFRILFTRKSRRNSVRAQLTFSVPVVARFWTFSLGMAKLHSEKIKVFFLIVAKKWKRKDNIEQLSLPIKDGKSVYGKVRLGFIHKCRHSLRVCVKNCARLTSFMDNTNHQFSNTIEILIRHFLPSWTFSSHGYVHWDANKKFLS